MRLFPFLPPLSVATWRSFCGASGLRTFSQAILRGLREIREGPALSVGRIRRPGAGRKSLTVSDPYLVNEIEEGTRGQPLRDYETIVSLIAKTTPAKGLKVGSGVRVGPSKPALTSCHSPQTSLFPERTALTDSKEQILA